MPIALPAGVSVKVQGSEVLVEKGKVSLANPLPAGITCAVDKGTVVFKRADDSRQQRALHGLTRALVANAVKGVQDGFSKDLEIVGIGYKAQVQGRMLSIASRTLPGSRPPASITRPGVARARSRCVASPLSHGRSTTVPTGSPRRNKTASRERWPFSRA